MDPLFNKFCVKSKYEDIGNISFHYRKSEILKKTLEVVGRGLGYCEFGLIQTRVEESVESALSPLAAICFGSQHVF